MRNLIYNGEHSVELLHDISHFIGENINSIKRYVEALNISSHNVYNCIHIPIISLCSYLYTQYIMAISIQNVNPTHVSFGGIPNSNIHPLVSVTFISKPSYIVYYHNFKISYFDAPSLSHNIIHP